MAHIQSLAYGYRAKTDFIAPSSARNTYRNHERCFLGVSLENHQFTLPKLAAMCEWINRRFKHCTVLVGDSIHRITLETTRDVYGDDALAQALHLGREFEASSRSIFGHYRGQTQFEFLTCGAVQSDSQCSSYLHELQSLYEASTVFRDSVESFGRSYHRRRSPQSSEAELDRRCRRSADYFLEEFAIFACLVDRGLSVMVYPGLFSTLAEIVNGEHLGVPASLTQLTIVSLKLRAPK